MVNIEKTKYKEFEAIKIENEKVSLITIPELGGKIISLKNKKSNFDFAFNNGPLDLDRVYYDSDYSKSTTYGIDECFPTIAPSKYTDYPWKGIDIPDHGEIWALEFDSLITGDNIVQRTYGIRFPYAFSRTINISDNRILFSYNVENLSSFDFKYIWSIHPHFNLFENTEVKINGDADFLIDFSRSKDLELKTKKYSWPFAETKDGRKIDFSKISKLNGNAEKLYLANLSEGEVKLIYHDFGEEISFIFDNNKNKDCGLWINRGGWPLDGKSYNTVAIEPCNCITDKFEESFKRNAFDFVKAKSNNKWEVSLIIKC